MMRFQILGLLLLLCIIRDRIIDWPLALPAFPEDVLTVQLIIQTPAVLRKGAANGLCNRHGEILIM